MGIARQLHVRIIKGVVVHRPGIRIPSLNLPARCCEPAPGNV